MNMLMMKINVKVSNSDPSSKDVEIAHFIHFITVFFIYHCSLVNLLRLDTNHQM